MINYLQCLHVHLLNYIWGYLTIEEITQVDTAMSDTYLRSFFLESLTISRIYTDPLKVYPNEILLYFQNRNLHYSPMRIRSQLPPLAWGCVSGHWKVVEMLLQSNYKQKLTWKNMGGVLSVSQMATVSGHYDIAEKLKMLYEIASEPIDANNLSGFACLEDLRQIVIPSYIKEIPFHAFGWCRFLKRVSLHSDIGFLDVQAFYGCQSLEEIFIPDNVKYIGYNCFALCRRLSIIRLPENFKVLESCTFQQTAVVNISFPKTLQKINSDCFNGCIFLREVDLSSTCIQSLESQAFYSCESLMHVFLPGTLQFIGSQCFQHCCSLVRIQIPGRVTVIMQRTFSNCLSLEEVILEEGTKVIGKRVFYDCVNLRRIAFPTTLQSIQMDSFDNCFELKNTFDKCLNVNFRSTSIAF